MGEVIVVYRIMPSDPDRFDSVKRGLEGLEPDRLEEEPVAFGIRAIRFTKAIPDRGGEQDRLEERIRSVGGVDNLELVAYSRAL